MSLLAAMIKWLMDRIEKIEFTRIDCSAGGYVIVESKDADSVMTQEAGEEMTLTSSTVRMTRHQFETLPEFNGF